MGGDTLVPTVAVYQMSLYPSRHNVDHVVPGSLDIVRILLAKCEKYGLGLIGEFYPECRELDRLAGRYKDSPAFRGVCLRLMSWVDPGLNNFRSLDWGCDDYTVGLFEKETGLAAGESRNASAL